MNARVLTLGLVAALLLALPARAACTGRNLLESLPAAVRADLDARVAAAPHAQGNLWRAVRGDQVLHLIGTYHLDDPRHDALLTRTGPLIAAAATLLVEAGPEEEAALKSAMAADPGLIFTTDGPTLPETLAPADWDALKSALRARDIPPFLGAKMRPWYLSVLLGAPPCALAQMAAGNGLDRRLMAQAETEGVPVRALEPYDTVFRIFQNQPAAEQTDMLLLSLAMADQAEDFFATLGDAYFAEDARMIWELSRLQAYNAPGQTPTRVDADMAAMEAVLMAGRNQAWIPVIEAALQDGPAVAAFGALHLSGDLGVLALLEDAGFTLERLAL